jgi:DNA processing protein
MCAALVTPHRPGGVTVVDVSPDAHDLPDGAYIASLAGFERMTTRRLRSLLAAGDPRSAFRIASGDAEPSGPLRAMLQREPELASCWRHQASTRPPGRCWQECVEGAIEVVVPGDVHFPAQLLDDPACPAALFVRGDLDVLDARRVGIVGTRNATQRGRETAAKFGFELAENGVVVISGLARGIDGAAHRGALAASSGAAVVGVVGNGLDRPYPKQHASLWSEVAARGALISEWPPGTAPDAFRFPLRNRILAALVEVLVVVESRERGGSLITAREALARQVEVMAVPGSLHNRAANGTNQLLSDGAAPATDTTEILVALGLDGRRAGRSRYDPRPRPRGIDADIVDACLREPHSIEHVVERFDLSIGDSALALARLERDGWLRETGGWFEALDRWDGLT